MRNGGAGRNRTDAGNRTYRGGSSVAARRRSISFSASCTSTVSRPATLSGARIAAAWSKSSFRLAASKDRRDGGSPPQERRFRPGVSGPANTRENSAPTTHRRTAIRPNISWPAPSRRLSATPRPRRTRWPARPYRHPTRRRRIGSPWLSSNDLSPSATAAQPMGSLSGCLRLNS